MTTKAELACVYSALVLIDDDVAITVSKNKKTSIFFVCELESIELTIGYRFE